MEGNPLHEFYEQQRVFEESLLFDQLQKLEELVKDQDLFDRFQNKCESLYHQYPENVENIVQAIIDEPDDDRREFNMRQFVETQTIRPESKPLEEISEVIATSALNPELMTPDQLFSEVISAVRKALSERKGHSTESQINEEIKEVSRLLYDAEKEVYRDMIENSENFEMIMNIIDDLKEESLRNRIMQQIEIGEYNENVAEKRITEDPYDTHETSQPAKVQSRANKWSQWMPPT